MRIKKAVVLLSGGLDSAVTLYLARAGGYDCRCLTFDYGQRHRREVDSAKRIARKAGVEWRLIKIRLPWKGSSLLDRQADMPMGVPASRRPGHIPNTYVPARNIIFLSFALSYAEAIGAGAIFIGANAIDYSGYPDCRPRFYRQFVRAAAAGTKTGLSGKPIKILTPLINRTKAQIIKLGSGLGVPYGLTWSCYKGGKRPCGKCDSCRFRARGFEEANDD